jgi:4-hydroxy-2-oxoheptanedioate aldolase
MSFINIIPSPVVTQALASAGADAVVIDQEHAPVGPESLHAMIASTAETKCLPFVRVTKRDEAMVKLALDFGARESSFHWSIRRRRLLIVSP